jgi:hypothetical protein
VKVFTVHAFKAYRMSRSTATLILNLVDGEEWLTSCPTHLPLGKKPDTFCRGSWADHKANMDILEK